MNESFRDENPYESPVVAEVVERKRPKWKPLPVGAIALALGFVFIASLALSIFIHPLFDVAFPLALVATLAFVCIYDFLRWLKS